jgi:hypothetical protein
MTAEAALPILVGAALLLLGRKLFWLFVAAAGFIAGFYLAGRLFAGANEWVFLAVALVAAVIGAFLAVVAQKIAVAIAGFLLGGYLAVQFTRAFVSAPEPYSWLAYLVGGIIGAILVLMIFDWALILLSSFAGASLVSQNLPLDRSVASLVFFGLLIAGVIVQARMRGAPREA